MEIRTVDTSNRIEAGYKKSLLVLRSQLTGRGYFRALVALEFALRYHSGLRKDNITPEFDHQVNIALFVLTLPDLQDQEGAIVVALLHDTKEDYQVHEADIVAAFDPEDRADALRWARSVELLNKYNPDGSAKDAGPLWHLMSRDVNASIVKPADRSHNLKTMAGVFGYQKQADYATFAEEHVLPMMKQARRVFPKQVNAYENMKYMIRTQIDGVRALLEARRELIEIRAV